MISDNAGCLLLPAVERHGRRKALVYRRGGGWCSISFAELEELCCYYCALLRHKGVRYQDRVLLMVKPGPELVALVFALFRLAAVPVLLDPGMGISAFLKCVARTEPNLLIGSPRAVALSYVCYRYFKSCKKRLMVGGGRWGVRLADELLLGSEVGCTGEQASELPGNLIVEVDPQETAAILFTSGSTGPAKGVVYRHEIFREQVNLLSELFSFSEGEVDMPGFPLFALFSLSLGLTCVIPELNPSRPAQAQPALLVQAVEDFEVHNLQGSPVIWQKLGEYCNARGIVLPSIKRVITFGAPIGRSFHRVLQPVVPQAEIFTPYGATEALPVACVSSEQLNSGLSEATDEGAGVCVGYPVDGVEVRIISVSDDVIASWNRCQVLPSGQIGEICVSGKVVTWAYDKDPESTAKAKIVEDDGTIWHRMGDLGYFDQEGRLWICGRKAHRVETERGTLYPVQAEGIVNSIPGIKRSALVGVGKRGEEVPVILVEPDDPKVIASCESQERLKTMIRARLAEHMVYRQVKTIMFHMGFPVDPRHNVKIHREELAAWVERRLQ